MSDTFELLTLQLGEDHGPKLCSTYVNLKCNKQRKYFSEKNPHVIGGYLEYLFISGQAFFQLQSAVESCLFFQEKIVGLCKY